MDLTATRMISQPRNYVWWPQELARSHEIIFDGHKNDLAAMKIYTPLRYNLNGINKQTLLKINIQLVY